MFLKSNACEMYLCDIADPVCNVGCNFAIMQRNSWDSTISINEVLRRELRFCCNNIDLFQGYHIKPPVATYAAVYTDASGTGHGGYTRYL